MKKILETIVKAVQELIEETVRKNARLDKIKASLNNMICGGPCQTSHTGGDNVDVEGMLPPKQNIEAYFNRRPG